MADNTDTTAEPDWYTLTVARTITDLIRRHRSADKQLARLLTAYEAARPPAGTTRETFDQSAWVDRYLKAMGISLTDPESDNRCPECGSPLAEPADAR